MILPTEKTKPATEFTKFNTLIHGLPGTGKTTFASTIGDNVIIAALERGYLNLSVYAVDITSWESFKDFCRSLKGSAFKTIAIDTTDILYNLCSKDVCKKNGWADPADGEYGKGFNAVKSEFMGVLNAVNMAGYSLVFISHSKEREAKTANGAEIKTMATSMSPSIELVVSAMVDFCFFLYADSNGVRHIRTNKSPHYLAKDRSGKLPDKMPLDFKLIQKYLTGEIVKTKDELKTQKESE